MEYFFAFWVFLFGLMFGSFLNVCIYRLPRGLSIVSPRSACPSCHTMIRAYDNIPVLSWVLLGGRCRDCKARISPRYFIIELITALLFLACFLKFGLTIATLKYCTLAFLLLGLIFTDAETKLLPDAMTLPGIVLGVIFSLFVPVNDLVSRLAPLFVPLRSAPEYSWRLLSLSDSLLGAAIGASFIYGTSLIYLRMRGTHGMGFGDVKLMAMIGAFLGVQLTIFTLFTASLAGSVYGIGSMLLVWMRRTRRRMMRNRESAATARKRAWQSARVVYRYYQMPFGVFLGGMAIIAVFFGNALFHWYWGLYLHF